MRRPIGFHIRLQMVKDCESGISYNQVAQKYNVRFNTVKTLHQRYLTHGQKGIQPHYQNCGKHLPSRDNLTYRSTCWLKRLHQDWGAQFIIIKIKERYPKMELPTARTLQRWFKINHLNKPRTKLPRQNGQWAKLTHEVWQVDAKERIVLADGSKGCWLTVVDEKTGATLATLVFPPQQDFTSTVT